MVACPEPHDLTWDGKPTTKESIEPTEAVALTLSRTSPLVLGELSQQLLLPCLGVLTWRAGQPPRTPAKGRRANTSKVFSVGLELAKHRINISDGLVGPRRALSSHILSTSGQQGKALLRIPIAVCLLRHQLPAFPCTQVFWTWEMVPGQGSFWCILS